MWKWHNRPLLQEKETATFDEKGTDLQDYLMYFENVSEWDGLEEGNQIVINLQIFLIRLLNYLVKNEVNLINAKNMHISPRDLMEGRCFKAWRCSLLPRNPRHLLIKKTSFHSYLDLFKLHTYKTSISNVNDIIYIIPNKFIFHVYLKRTRKLVENITQHEAVFKETTMNIFMEWIYLWIVFIIWPNHQQFQANKHA